MDDATFEAAWHTHGQAVARYCAFSAGSSDVAQDLCAEVFVRYLRHGERIPEDRVAAWLFRVARNLCVTYHRSARRSQELHNTLWVSVATHPDWEDPASAIDPEIVAALGRLDEPQKLAVYLRVVEDRPFTDVAKALGRGTGATRMLVLRALRRLKTDLSSSGTDAPTYRGRDQHA